MEDKNKGYELNMRILDRDVDIIFAAASAK